MVAWKSLARRRLRPSQAKKRSNNPSPGMDGEADLVGLLFDDLDRDLGRGESYRRLTRMAVLHKLARAAAACRQAIATP